MAEFQFQIRVLGRPGVVRPDGTEVQVPVGKPLALLTYLALTQESASRDHLGELLWPDVPRNNRRASLRQALWILRRALGEDLFPGDDPVELAPGRVEVDLRQAERLAQDGRPLEALELWKSPPFQEFLLPDVPGWERWTEERRLQAEERMVRALAARGEEAEGAGDLESAARAYRAATEIRPERLRSALALLRVLLARRAFQEAEEVIARGRALLATDEPAMEELDRSEAELRALRRGAYSGTEEEGVPRARFVGRIREFAALVRLWERTRPGAGQRALILGEAGIGKTRLADELSLLVRSRGGRIVRVKGQEGESQLRWGTASAMVRQLSSLSGAAGVSPAADDVLRTLVPSLPGRVRRGRSPGGGGLGRQRAAPPDAAVVDALGDLVAAVSEDGPLLLVVDDLHWVDQPSRDALVALIRQMEAEPVLWVLVTRTGVPDVSLKRSLRFLSEGPRAIRLRLEPWSREEVAELLGAVARFPDPEALERAATMVHQVGGGSPLFTVEILKLLVDREVLVQDDDPEAAEQPHEETGWAFNVRRLPERLALPESVRDLLSDQILRLSAPSRRLLETLLSAPGLQPDELRIRAGLTAAEMTDGLTELLDRALVRWLDGDRVDFAHDEVRAVARKHLEPEQPGTLSLLAWVRERPPALAGLLGVTALLTLAASISLFSDESPPPAYGGGSIVIALPDRVVEIVPDHRTADQWAARSPAWFHPVGRTLYPAAMGPDGTPLWFERRNTLEDAPWIVQHLPEGRERILVRTEGDDFFRDVSPDGERFLFTSENRERPEYRLDLWVGELDREDRRLLLAAEDRVGPAKWSPDGGRIAALLRGDPDTVVLLTPDGQRLGKAPAPGVVHMDWCGEDGLLISLRTEMEMEMGVFWLEDYTIQRLEPEGYPMTHAACSPDGRAVLYPVVSRGEVSYHLHDLESGETVRLPFSHELQGDLQMAWLPAGPVPAPRALEVSPSPTELRWGESAVLTPRVVRSDGSRVPAEEVRWTAGDPSVLSVTAEGRIYANDLGKSWVAATWRSWLTDTVRVRVTGTPGEGTLLAEDFRSLDPDRWIFVGAPRPRAAVLDGEPVLELTGDGRHWDGILLRERFPGMQGVTAEVELRLPLTGGDRQWFRLCLFDHTPPEPHEEAGGGPAAGPADPPMAVAEVTDIYTIRSRARQRSCLRFPGTDGGSPNPGRIEFSVLQGIPAMTVPLPDHVSAGGEDWLHLALQLRADGELQVWADRSLVGTAPILVRNGPGTLWRVGLFGASVDTEGYARNLTVWQGTRYGPDG